MQFGFDRRTYQPEDIVVQDSPIHGRGVFANRSFKAGELIEIAPLILLDSPERELLQTTKLFHYYFLIGDPQFPVALGLGYSSLYNHAGKSNAQYSVSLKDSALLIRACKPIAAGDEITLNYNGSPDDETPVQFPAVTI